MFKIAEKELLAPDTWLMKIEAPRVARAAMPGQFVIVRATEEGERIPLTIADYDARSGLVTVVVQAVGVSTRKIVELNGGESLSDFAGPLGQPSDFVREPIEELRKRRILFVAGGVGAAPVYPQVKWLRERGVDADVIIGARASANVIMSEEMEHVAENLYIATDDGSAGFHGNVTQLMRELIEVRGKHYDEVITIGPMIMMKFVAQLTAEYGLKTVASLNSLMIDGTGMCGACRVSVGGQIRFACVDGPEFDAHKIDFDEAMRRQRMYRDMEGRANELFAKKQKDHSCRIGLDKVKLTTEQESAADGK